MLDNKIKWFYGTDNGFELCDDVTAELGITAEAGTLFKIAIDGTCLKNYTLTDEGVTGDECSNTDGTWGYTFKCVLTKTSSGAEGDPELLQYEVSDDNANIRLAMFLQKNDNGTESFITWNIKTYNVDTHAWGSGVPWMYVNMDNNFRLYKISIPSTPPPGYVQNYDARLDNIMYNYNKVGGYGFPYSTYFNLTRLATNIPIFDTEQHAKDYLQDETNETIEGILNYVEPDPEKDYEDARKYNYAWNIYGHNSNNATQYTGYRNYRFYGGDGKICFYRVKATSGSPYTVKLYHYENYVIKSAGVHDTDDDDFETIQNPELLFLHTSIQFSSNDFYTKFKFNTDLLIFGSEAQAEMWVRDEIDARSAENFNQVSRAYDTILDPGYGNPDAGNDNGVNGQSYVHGARLWVLNSSQLNHFFDDIFDPVHISDILDGTKLLGDGINAVQGITYFPIDIDDVATVNGTADPIKIGSYQCPTATGRYVWNNNKIIDCGSVFIAPVYNDFRDYRIKLYISLPYCGVHSLEPISKYLGKNLQVKYAVDITTGACSAHILADGISYGDTFDGFMASQRPLTALDQTAYLNSVMGCVSSMFARETGMLNTAVGGMVGATTGKDSVGGGDIGGLNTSAGAISDLYGLSQAVKDTPMNTRGGFAGCLGFFGNQKIHIITAQSKTVKPGNELNAIGYPSGIGGTVGMFSGYLKCSVFRMADGFTGTLDEFNEIISIMNNGIYL